MDDQKVINYIIELLSEYSNNGKQPIYSDIASKVLIVFEDLQLSHRTVRRYVSNYHKQFLDNTSDNRNENSREDEIIDKTAWEQWKLDNKVKEEDVKSVKSWTLGDGTQTFSVVFKNGSGKSKSYDKEIEQIKNHFTNRSYDRYIIERKKDKIGFVSIADIHIGALILNLIKTPDYDPDIAAALLNQAADEINEMQYSEVHVGLLGDLIESFTGKNHPDNFKSIKNGYTGQSKEDDAEGEIAKLIWYILSDKLTVNVEYGPYVISTVVDGVCYTLLHGHHGVTKNDIDSIVWKYGKQGMFNVIISGHLHKRDKKRKTESTIYYESNDVIWYGCPSIFPGNFYSETGGWTGYSGFYQFIAKNNKVQVIDTPLCLH